MQLLNVTTVIIKDLKVIQVVLGFSLLVFNLLKIILLHFVNLTLIPYF